MQQIHFLNILMKFVIYALLSCCYFSVKNLLQAVFSYKSETSWSFELDNMKTLFSSSAQVPFFQRHPLGRKKLHLVFCASYCFEGENHEKCPLQSADEL